MYNRKIEQMSFLQTVKRFFEPIRYDYWFILKPFLRSVWWSFFAVYTVETFKKATLFIQNNDYNNLLLTIGIFGVVLIIYCFINYLARDVGWATMAYEGLKLFQNDWMPKFFKLENTEVEKLGTGKLINIMESGFKTWNRMFQDIVNIVPAILIIGTYSFIQIGKAGGLFSIIIFFLTVVLTIFVGFMNKKAILHRKQRNELEGDYSRQFVKMLMSKMEIVQNDKTKSEISKTNKILSTTTAVNYKINFYLWAMFEPTRWLSHILKISILIYGGYMMKNGNTNFSEFVGLVAIVSIFENEMNRFLEFYKDFTNNFSQVQRLRDTFDKIKKIKNDFKDVNFLYKKGDFVINDLTFGYSEEKLVFESFSVIFEGGKKTALVGVSGSGKTTLIKLLAGYLLPTKGNIKVDGQDIGKLDINNYYKHIGYLTQDPGVFDGTIYENLVYALDTELPQEDLEKVIKLAKCEFIREFEKGLETEIGERGVRLSGGQKQRLAIAKIMIKNPNIILLDEPTSALDSFNEEEISIALHNLFKGKTVIVAAHRLQTVKQADKIFLFEQGKILEEGTHEELVKLNKKYKKMLDLQSGF